MLEGNVIHGKGYGTKLGYPTINVPMNMDRDVPISRKLADGIYAGSVLVKDQRYVAACVIEPVASGQPRFVEAHLMGYSGDLYGQSVVVELVEYIRPFIFFESESDLIKQIQYDIKKIQEVMQ